ncbi:hypothetical protein N5T82_07610 [Aliarcobacter cryaerophilus]|uniref:hypothetical protein n=1 Tax=Aliarcobacter cryaerophilus TaxID=28198 RepID=UPI0021B50632|nr:hypothetical protein [Aliarcobacter cryaerophilus]MCT7539701.1 hypothetical protein [Aliarcobacter cryaerophilus]
MFLPLLYAVFLFVISDDKLSAFRSLAGYTTVAFVPIVFYYILKNYFYLFVKFLKFTTITYFIVGVIQIVYDRNFFSFILNRISTTDTRGITSLTVEPTFYGIVCLFLILIFISLNIKDKNKYIYLLLFQIIFLAQSSMTILFLLVFGFYYFLFKLNIKTVSISILFILFIVLLLSNIEISSYNLRVIDLANKFIEKPTSIFIADASINDRVSAIYFSIKGFFDNYGIVNGFGTYSTYLENQLQKQDTFWWVSVSNRIMSYYGGVFFELGFIGLLIPVIYSVNIIKAYRYDIKSGFLYLFFIHSILMTAIPLSFPLVGVYIATLLYKAKHETLNNPQ